MSLEDMEQHWRAILHGVNEEHDRQELAKLITKVNQILDAIERRLREFGDIRPH